MLGKLLLLKATVPAKAIKPSVTELFAPVNTAPADWQFGAKTAFSERLGIRPEVEDSDDLQRIIALPRRPQLKLDAPFVKEFVARVTARFRRDRPEGCGCSKAGRACITELKPAQAWALDEITQTGGLVGAIGVGHGKTGLDILAPLALSGCRTAVLLIPSSLQKQFARDYLIWAEHFRVPSLIIGAQTFIVPGSPVLHVVPFSKFSRPQATTLLESIQPDTIIVDEAHKIRHANTATTSRVLRYFTEHRSTRLLCWSGTITSDSIKNYAHLCALALRERSPLPIDPTVVASWALAIDPSEWQAPIGKLRQLCKPGEHIYEAFNRRLVETQGFIATRSGSIDAAINMFERKVKVPAKIEELLARLRDPDVEGGWCRPDGEEFIDALQVQACARQLAAGFYYRWKFPKGEPVELIEEWFAARKAWNKELRAKLKTRRELLDSEDLCTKAAERYHCGYVGELPVWKSEFWPAWNRLKNTVYHETEAVWLDDFLVDDACQWLAQHRGICWYEHEAFGERVAQKAGLPLHSGGPKADARIRAEKGDRSLVVSRNSHGTGRDGLQLLFHEQLFSNPPSSGDAWEQNLGRLHRIGQKADEVNTWVYRHTVEMAEAIDKAVIKAKYIQGTIGTSQKLLVANCDFDFESEG